MKKVKKISLVSVFILAITIMLSGSMPIFNPNRIISIETENASSVHETEIRVSRYNAANQTNEIARSR